MGRVSVQQSFMFDNGLIVSSLLLTCFDLFSSLTSLYPLSLSLSLQIADSLPLSWFKGENNCLPQLQNFENYLVQKVHTICKQQSPKDPDTR